MDQPGLAGAGERRVHPAASLGIALIIIALHVGIYLPLVLVGIEYRANPVANAVFAALAMVWMTLPLACIYGAAVGFRSARRDGWSALPALGVFVNCLYALVSVFLWLLVATGVSV